MGDGSTAAGAAAVGLTGAVSKFNSACGVGARTWCWLLLEQAGLGFRLYNFLENDARAIVYLQRAPGSYRFVFGSSADRARSRSGGRGPTRFAAAHEPAGGAPVTRYLCGSSGIGRLASRSADRSCVGGP